MAYCPNIMQTYETDVLVCGLGPAGVTAAVAAARGGARVMGIERWGFAGGNLTAASVSPACGLVDYANGHLDVGGIPLELLQRTGTLPTPIPEGPIYTPPKPDRVCYDVNAIPISWDTEMFKLCADRLMLESGVEILYHTRIIDVITNRGYIEAVVIANKDGIGLIRPHFAIDCTGDADVAAWAGAPCEIRAPKDLQPGTMMFQLAGLDIDLSGDKDAIYTRYQSFRERCAEALYQATRDGRLSHDMLNPPYPLRVNPMLGNIVVFNTSKVPVVAIDAKSLTEGEIHSREGIRRIVDVLRSDVAECRNAQLLLTGPQLGCRESRRIIGRYVLRAEDLYSAARFEDTIGHGNWPIDVPVNVETEQKSGFILPEDCVRPYDIPYRTLLPFKIDNLLVAGRCHSADFKALGSTRVELTCMVMGEGAGTAAVIAMQKDCSPDKIPIDILQSRLIANKVLL